MTRCAALSSRALSAGLAVYVHDALYRGHPGCDRKQHADRDQDPTVQRQAKKGLWSGQQCDALRALQNADVLEVDA
jgi:hypothetical protein